MYAPVVTERQERSRQHRPGRRLRILGWVLFAGTYGITILVGMPGMLMDPEISWPNMLPLVGPAVSGTIVLQDGEEELLFLGIFGWLSAAIQITGLALAITGHVRGRRGREGRERNRSFAIAPVAGPNGQVGLSAVGRF